jgi:cysteine desulfuration protein SufE
MADLTVDRIIQNFEILGNWEERYRYVIDLGRKLPELDEKYKTEDNRVKGCVSNVWLITRVNDEDQKMLEFDADSDAHIVRGLVAILLAAYSGKSADEILAIDIRDIFQQLDLENHLSPSRSNGFFSMVERIQTLAKAASTA